jgi:predicted aspartyl protease
VDIHRLPNRAVGITAFIVLAALSICVRANGASPGHIGGSVAVPIHYAPLNKMIIGASINGHTANLLVDTGASQTMLDTEAAQLCGVAANQFGGRRYIGYQRFNGQLAPIAFIRNLTAGGMNLGNLNVALIDSSGRGNFAGSAGTSTGRVDGILGADVLVPHKAVINTRTKFVFFQPNGAPALQLASVASGEKFTKVPLRREENGGFTVPCSVGGQNGRVFVDTGAFVTTFNQALFKSLGVALQPAHVSARFSDGVSRDYEMGEVKNLVIGDFKVPPKKFGTASLPRFTSQGGGAPIVGILGMDLLYDCHAIIDFGSMNLFLK